MKYVPSGRGMPLQGRFDQCRYEDPDTGCWEWMGHLVLGYGSMKVMGRQVKAHRVAWELYRGPISPGHHIHHTCENTTCVNPDHLEMLSPGDHKRLHTSKITHCPKGHEYTPENTKVYRGCRGCRTCQNDAKRDKRTRARGTA